MRDSVQCGMECIVKHPITRIQKRQWSTGRTAQLRSDVSQSVQPLIQSSPIQHYQTKPLSIDGSIAEQPTRMLIDSSASLTLIITLNYSIDCHIILDEMLDILRRTYR